MTTFLNKRSISTMNNKSYIAFCDGSCQLDNKGNNVGGYGAVIYDQNHIKIKDLPIKFLLFIKNCNQNKSDQVP